MDKLQVVKFDVRGTRPENRVLLEKIPIKDKTCPWIVPNGTPYFAENLLVSLYNELGGKLILGTDYWFDGEFPPFCEITGRSICSYFRLSERTLTQNKFVTATYQSIGAWFVPRNNIDQWVKEMHEGKLPIPWDKVFNVPPELPAEYHKHSIKTEIGDWYELTFFFDYLANIYSTRDPAIYEDADKAINESFEQLLAVKQTQLARINDHDANYNDPHGTTKFHLNLGNLDNYSTATIAQTKAGIATNLFVTPQGVMELSEDYDEDTRSIMRSGVIPISKFGEGGYIPPYITGSFEGLGSRSECMGINIEETAGITAIQNHFDGRTEGLYFSTLSDYKNVFTPNNPYDFKFTGYRYTPPALLNRGVEPNNILAGSGNEVIMVGRTTKNNPAANDRWFVALTNGNFDPAGHLYIETSMAAVFTQCGNPDANGEWASLLYHGRMSVHLLNQYVYLVVDAPMDGSKFSQAGRMTYFRVPHQALIEGIDTPWELVKLTYQDWDGIQYTNVNYWEFAQKVVNAGTVSKWGRYTFSPLPPTQEVGRFSNRILTMLARKPSTTNTVYLNLIAHTFLDWTPPGKGYFPATTITNMVYELNVDTGVMTLIYKQPALQVDYENNNLAVINQDREQRISWVDPTVRYLYPATVIDHNGGRLSSITGVDQQSSALNAVIQYTNFTYTNGGVGVTSKADLLKGSLGTERIIPNKTWSRTRSINSPIPTGISSRWLAYETQGENFMTNPTPSKEGDGGVSLPKVMCRNVTGGYTIRPEVTNQGLSPVYSRPLVNTVFNTNMTYQEAVISMTGSASELTNRGVDSGNMSLSVGGWSTGHPTYPVNTVPGEGFRAPNEDGAFLSFPKTFSRTLDVSAKVMHYIPNSFYGLPESLKEKIKNLIPAVKQGQWWCFTLAVLNGETGGMFAGLTRALLHVKYPSQANGSSGTWDAQMFLVDLVVEVPNLAHPGVYMITDFQVIGNSVIYIAHENIRLDAQGGYVTVNNRSLLSLYRENNIVQGTWSAGFSCLGETDYSDFATFTIDLVTGIFSQVGAAQNAWYWGDIMVVLPKVGRSRFALTAPDTYNAKITDYTLPAVSSETSGTTARIYPVVRQDGQLDYYATVTAYPETGWVIFFLEEVSLMITGTAYTVPAGSIDLRDVDPNPANKVFYLYITIEDSTPKYVLSTIKLRRGNAMLHIGTVTTNSTQIVTLSITQPFVIGDYEMSYTRNGGIIPVSTGFPQDEGVFKFLRMSELLP